MKYFGVPTLLGFSLFLGLTRAFTAAHWTENNIFGPTCSGNPVQYSNVPEYHQVVQFCDKEPGFCRPFCILKKLGLMNPQGVLLAENTNSLIQRLLPGRLAGKGYELSAAFKACSATPNLTGPLTVPQGCDNFSSLLNCLRQSTLVICEGVSSRDVVRESASNPWPRSFIPQPPLLNGQRYPPQVYGPRTGLNPANQAPIPNSIQPIPPALTPGYGQYGERLGEQQGNPQSRFQNYDFKSGMPSGNWKQSGFSESQQSQQINLPRGQQYSLQSSSSSVTGFQTNRYPSSNTAGTQQYIVRQPNLTPTTPQQPMRPPNGYTLERPQNVVRPLSPQNGISPTNYPNSYTLQSQQNVGRPAPPLNGQQPLIPQKGYPLGLQQNLVRPLPQNGQLPMIPQNSYPMATQQNIVRPLPNGISPTSPPNGYTLQSQPSLDLPALSFTGQKPMTPPSGYGATLGQGRSFPAIQNRQNTNPLNYGRTPTSSFSSGTSSQQSTSTFGPQQTSGYGTPMGQGRSFPPMQNGQNTNPLNYGRTPTSSFASGISSQQSTSTFGFGPQQPSGYGSPMGHGRSFPPMQNGQNTNPLNYGRAPISSFSSGSSIQQSSSTFEVQQPSGYGSPMGQGRSFHPMQNGQSTNPLNYGRPPISSFSSGSSSQQSTSTFGFGPQQSSGYGNPLVQARSLQPVHIGQNTNPQNYGRPPSSSFTSGGSYQQATSTSGFGPQQPSGYRSQGRTFPPIHNLRHPIPQTFGPPSYASGGSYQQATSTIGIGPQQAFGVWSPRSQARSFPPIQTGQQTNPQSFSRPSSLSFASESIPQQAPRVWNPQGQPRSFPIQQTNPQNYGLPRPLSSSFSSGSSYQQATSTLGVPPLHAPGIWNPQAQPTSVPIQQTNPQNYGLPPPLSSSFSSGSRYQQATSTLRVPPQHTPGVWNPQGQQRSFLPIQHTQHMNPQNYGQPPSSSFSSGSSYHQATSGVWNPQGQQRSFPPIKPQNYGGPQSSSFSSGSNFQQATSTLRVPPQPAPGVSNPQGQPRSFPPMNHPQHMNLQNYGKPMSSSFSSGSSYQQETSGVWNPQSQPRSFPPRQPQNYGGPASASYATGGSYQQANPTFGVTPPQASGVWNVHGQHGSFPPVQNGKPINLQNYGRPPSAPYAIGVGYQQATLGVWNPQGQPRSFQPQNYGRPPSSSFSSGVSYQHATSTFGFRPQQPNRQNFGPPQTQTLTSSPSYQRSISNYGITTPQSSRSGGNYQQMATLNQGFARNPQAQSSVHQFNSQARTFEPNRPSNYYILGGQSYQARPYSTWQNDVQENYRLIGPLKTGPISPQPRPNSQVGTAQHQSQFYSGRSFSGLPQSQQNLGPLRTGPLTTVQEANRAYGFRGQQYPGQHLQNGYPSYGYPYGPLQTGPLTTVSSYKQPNPTGSKTSESIKTRPAEIQRPTVVESPLVPVKPQQAPNPPSSEAQRASAFAGQVPPTNIGQGPLKNTGKELHHQISQEQPLKVIQPPPTNVGHGTQTNVREGTPTQVVQGQTPNAGHHDISLQVIPSHESGKTQEHGTQNTSPDGHTSISVEKPRTDQRSETSPMGSVKPYNSPVLPSPNTAEKNKNDHGEILRKDSTDRDGSRKDPPVQTGNGFGDVSGGKPHGQADPKTDHSEGQRSGNGPGDSTRKTENQGHPQKLESPSLRQTSTSDKDAKYREISNGLAALAKMQSQLSQSRNSKSSKGLEDLHKKIESGVSEHSSNQKPQKPESGPKFSSNSQSSGKDGTNSAKGNGNTNGNGH